MNTLTRSPKLHLRWSLGKVGSTEQIELKESIFIGRVSGPDDEDLHDIGSHLAMTDEDPIWQSGFETSNLLHDALHLPDGTNSSVGIHGSGEAVALENVYVQDISDAEITMPGVLVPSPLPMAGRVGVGCHESVEALDGCKEYDIAGFPEVRLLEHHVCLSAKITHTLRKGLRGVGIFEMDEE